MRPRTAGIIIIGNEILSGKIADENSHYLARGLRELGVDLKRVVVIPDDVDLIADEVRWFSDTFSHVFTSGGVGPTHDDVTMEGVAAAFGVGLRESRKLARLVKAWCQAGREERALKMALIPEGAEVLTGGGVRFPLVRMENVYIFPGIPEYLSQKFDAIKERFRGAPYRLKKVYVGVEECYITEELDRLVAEFPGVMVGSYPKVNYQEYKVLITLESADAPELATASERLLSLLPEASVVRVE